MAIKAICLLSGGLDSALAAKLLVEQGIDVVLVHFTGPFSRRQVAQGGSGEAQKSARVLGLPLITVDITRDFFEILIAPKHGYGSNMNPCIDCHILMLKKASEIMAQQSAQFLVTGEVVGQRPMSQRLETILKIEKEAGVEGLVLRPLSAQLFAPTVAEQNGWVARDRLLSISGRSRKTQIDLARQYRLSDNPCSAGGCHLTDQAFSRRLLDLKSHGELTLEDFELLRWGRYFRLGPETKLFVGRDQSDNEGLRRLKRPEDMFWMPFDDLAGASGLGRGVFSDPSLRALAGGIVGRYFDKEGLVDGKAALICEDAEGIKQVQVLPLTDEETKRYLI